MLLGFTAHGCSGTETGPSLTANVASGPLVYHGVYHADLEAAKSVAVHVPDVADSWQLTVDTVLPDGSRVEKDDVILTFVKETLEMDLRDELDKLEVAKAQRRKVAQSLERERIELQLEVDRRKLAVERAELAVVEGVNFVSELDVDKARLDVDKAKLELELAEDALEAFREKKATALRVEDLKVEAAQRAVDLKKEGLGSVEVRAPVSGVLYAPYTRLNWQRTKVAPGVVARPGDKILEIPDLSAYHAVMFARPRDAALISVGDEAVVYPTILPDRGIEATVIEKEDFATTRNEREGTETPAGNLKEHRIVLELKEAPTALRPGNTARVEISSVVSEDTLSVPLVALHESEDDGSRYVVLESGERREVSVGATTLTHAAIEEGLEGGDVVVLDAGKSPAVDDDSARGSTL
jgi:hypothetical protein